MSSEEFSFSIKTVSAVQICLTALIPISLMFAGFSLLYYIIDNKEENMPKKNKVKSLFYYLAQFLFMPLLLFFFLTNTIVIIITYFFCSDVYYFTGKDIVRRINIFTLCKEKKIQKVNTIKIESNKSITEQKKDNNKSDFSLNMDASANLLINNLNNKPPNKIIEQKDTIKASDYPRPITNKKPNKSKILDFINSVLSNTSDKDDESPIYINLLNRAKNKVKDSKEKNKQLTPSIYNSNLGKDKY